MICAIVPARGGSKRIKKKNIKIFFSKPILYWTFNILKKSKIFDKIILSTDDEKIKKVGKSIGFDIILSRPKSLSDDLTPTKPVVEHSINYLNNLFKINFVCCVYACNPFLNISDLKKSLNILKKNKFKFIFPVSEYSHPIQRAFKLGRKNEIIFYNKKNELTRTQDLTKSFHDAGQFYWGTPKNWLSKKKLHSNAIGLQIPKWRTVDIDDSEDWKKAEAIFKFFKLNEKN